jgi:hypothetical protein
MMLVMVKEADLNRIEVREDYEILDAHQGSQLVRQHRARGGDRLGYRHLAQYRFARRTVALGSHP